MKPILSNLDLGNVAKVVNSPDPTVGTDVANKQYVDAAIEGISWKDSVRVASTANVNTAAPGATIDTIALANNDRVLLKDQTNPIQNGIYVYNGSATPMTRAADASTFNELEGAVVIVEEGGANAGTNWRQTQTNGVLDTNNIAFTAFLTGAAAASETVTGVAEIATQTETDTGTDDLRIVTPLKLKSSKLFNKSFAGTIGDGSATSFNLDHNLNTRDVIVSVYKNSGNYDEVLVDVTRPTVNRVTVTFAAAPAANAYRVAIQGTQV